MQICIDELFDELALISFESAEEQAKSEAAFWNSDAVESSNSDSEVTDCDDDSAMSPSQKIKICTICPGPLNFENKSTVKKSVFWSKYKCVQWH